MHHYLTYVEQTKRVLPAQCHVLLEFGRRRGYLPANPAADITIRPRPEVEVSILTPDELRNLLSKCAPEIVPYVAICALAGLRPSEAASLLWSDAERFANRSWEQRRVEFVD